MRVFIISVVEVGPFKAYSDQEKAYSEYNKLQKRDDLVNYSLTSLKVQEQVSKCLDCEHFIDRGGDVLGWCRKEKGFVTLSVDPPLCQL